LRYKNDLILRERFSFPKKESDARAMAVPKNSNRVTASLHFVTRENYAATAAETQE